MREMGKSFREAYQNEYWTRVIKIADPKDDEWQRYEIGPDIAEEAD